MLPFAHAMAGTAAFPLQKNRDLKNFLLCMFFGILPDFDIIIPSWLPWLAHRNLTHTIIPFALIVGIFTLLIWKNFWLGFIPVTTHFILDWIGPGSVSIFPGVKLSTNILPYANADLQAFVSGLVGSVILVFWIITLYLKKHYLTSQKSL